MILDEHISLYLGHVILPLNPEGVKEPPSERQVKLSEPIFSIKLSELHKDS